MAPLDFLPADVNTDDVLCTLALVSDTHFLQRLAHMPESLPQLLSGCDLILHAGDVGDLGALDFLGKIAPVVAVQGNDDSLESFASLPLQIVTAVGGQRVFLWHSHHVDPVAERNSRAGDELLPKLQRTVDAARSAGASLAVFGHWHIPLVYDTGDLVVVNPGALAAANEVTRQLKQTIALAILLHGGEWRIVHVDIANAEEPLDAVLDWNAGFQAAMRRYSTSILSHALRTQMPLFKAQISEEMLARLRKAVEAAAAPVWAGEAPLLSWQDVASAARGSGLFAAAEMARLQEIVDAAQQTAPPMNGDLG